MDRIMATSLLAIGGIIGGMTTWLGLVVKTKETVRREKKCEQDII